jgi:large subunit ribosomal protein L4
MPEADIVNIRKEKIGTVELADQIFGVKVNKPLIHEVAIMQLACMRQGTAATKTRGLVSGGGRKPWRQKGTGRARAGSIRSPLWRGGGTTFGPQPRDYSYSIPRKKYRAALRGVLSAKFRDGEVIILDQLPISEPKTKRFIEVLKNLGFSKKTLIVLDEIPTALELSARNVSWVNLISVGSLNVYDLLSHTHIVITQDAVGRIQEVWS